MFGRRLKDFKRIYEYQGEATCAADGMCQEKCPVKINTGELIKSIRAEQMKDMKQASGGAMVSITPVVVILHREGVAEIATVGIVQEVHC